ncbi:MAG: META domain-containing protein [Deltaproteobacteria bacterium]|nr:META domain-containing protein [Deltaproteobacteria bacterium]
MSALVTACVDEDDEKSMDSDDTEDISDALMDGAFVVTGATEDGEKKTFVADTVISIQFGANGQLSAQAGCNSMFGGFALEEDILKVSAMGMTEMGCDEALHEQDDWIYTVLTSRPELTFENDVLTMETTLDDGTKVRLTLKEDDAPN